MTIDITTRAKIATGVAKRTMAMLKRQISQQDKKIFIYNFKTRPGEI